MSEREDIIVARHTAERISSQAVALNLLILLRLAGIDTDISQVAGKLLLELPNSRAQEREGICEFTQNLSFIDCSADPADYIGLRLMAKACYDPGAAPQ